LEAAVNPLLRIMVVYGIFAETDNVVCRLVVASMHDNERATLQYVFADLQLFDASDVSMRFEHPCGDNRRSAIRCNSNDVRILCRGLSAINRANQNVEFCSELLRQAFSVCRGWTVDTDFPQISHIGHCKRLCAGLPSGTNQPERVSIVGSHVP